MYSQQTEPALPLKLDSLPVAENSLLPAEFTGDQPQNIAFVDAGLSQIDTLIQGLENTQVVLIDSQQNGVDQITAAIAQYTNLSSVHIFSHGREGSVQLGDAALSNSTVGRYRDHLQSWKTSLSSEADLLFYGCNLAAGSEGLAFINQVSQLTGADVAASNDLTGIGGDWQLEVTVGEIESDVALSSAAQAAYTSTLEDILSNGDFELGLADWSGYTGTESISTTEFVSGGRSLQHSAAGSGVAQILDATVGETYTLTGSAKSSSGGYTGIGINFFDADFNVVGGQSQRITSGRWREYQIEAIAPTDTLYAQIWTYKDDDVGSFFVDNLSVETGTDVPPIQPPGAGEELLDNSGFETDLANWASFTGSEAISTAESFNGDGSLQLTAAGSGVSQFVEAIALQEYQATTYAKTSSTEYVGFGINFFDADYTLLTGSTSETITSADWQQYQSLSTAPAGTRYAQVWTFKADAAGDAFFDDVSLSLKGTDPPVVEPGFISLQTSNLDVDEDAGSVTITVQRTGGSDGEVTVEYRTVEGSGRAATAGEDYSDRTGTLTFADGETEQSVVISILNDSLAEGTETFGFTIDNVLGGATLLAPRTAQVAISDDDTLTYRGNQYVLTSSSKTWEQAQAEAESLGGNLVTINAAAEEAWLKQNFGESEGYWIGINDAGTEGVFEWASGETVGYTNWAPGEPNNFGGDQDYGWMNFNASKQWDDNSDSATFRGIIEIGDDNTPDGSQGNGLRAEYYNNRDFTSLALTRTDATVDFNWGTGSPDPTIGSDNFSVRWSGSIEALYSETYTFETTSDDGIQLWINNQLIIDQFIDQAPTVHRGTITLEAGQQYDIRMDYYENGGGAVAKLSWSSDSQSLEVVPTSQLYSEPVIDNRPAAETVVSNLNSPTAIDWRPNSSQMFIAEKGGKIEIYEDGVLLPTPFIDISDQVNGTRDRGLLDIALHPDFENNPYVYLLFTYDPPEVFDNTGEAGPDGKNNRASRLIRVTADVTNGYRRAIADSEVVLLGTNSTWDNFNGFANSTFDFDEPEAGVLPDGSYLQDFLNSDSESHTIGSVEFGPDGALYVSNGDGASYNRVDPRAARVQDIDSLSGKILRIDPITGAGLSDNPFYNGDVSANRSKVYQLGLRNPFRMTIDPDGGQVYIGDVGWTQWEEINAADAGANFGWPYYEGGSGESIQTGGYQSLSEAQAFYNSNPSVTPSLLGLNHRTDGINAIVMGDLYTGNVYSEEYRGDLFFNDLGQGLVRNVSFDNDGNIEDVETFVTGAASVVQMAQGPDELMYYVNLVNGTVGRWVFS